jgi:hypothetical protein
MLKSLANLLRSKFAGARSKKGASGDADPLVDDTAPIFEGLAMTDELREALFPKQTQMVSAIFDRPPPLERPHQAPAPAPMQSSGSGGGGFSIPL